MNIFPLTASPSEVLQTLIALVGLLLEVRALRRVLHLKREAVRRRLNGRTAFWAQSRVRQELMLCVLQLVWFVMGIVSLMLPPPYAHEELALQGTLRTAALIIGTLGVAAFSFANEWDRHWLNTYEERHPAESLDASEAHD